MGRMKTRKMIHMPAFRRGLVGRDYCPYKPGTVEFDLWHYGKGAADGLHHSEGLAAFVGLHPDLRRGIVGIDAVVEVAGQ